MKKALNPTTILEWGGKPVKVYENRPLLIEFHPPAIRY
jgi:hypothetical protein